MDNPRRILIVDDDPDIRRLLCDVLTLDGYLVSCAGDGLMALASIEDSPPDAMVLDVMMPGLDGFEVLARVRATETAHLPVVMLTALADDEHAWQAWTGGVDYFLPKPFDPADLVRWLDFLFSERRVG